MKNTDKITKITMRVEFKCDSRIGYVECEVNSDEIVALQLRRAIDDCVFR